jgi:protease-4
MPALLMGVEYPYPYYPLPEYSAASTFGGLSIFQNPAALAVNPDVELMYIHSFNSHTFAGDNTFLLSRSGIGFGYQNYRLSVDDAISAYSLAFSSRVARGFYAGAVYAFMKTDDGNPYHNDHFWNVGVLWRYRPEASFALIAKNLMRMEFGGNATEIEYVFSVGLRPIQDRLTVSANWDWNESQSFSDGTFRIFVNVKAREGMGILGSIDKDGNFGLGVNLSFGTNQIGTYHSYSDHGDYRSGLLYSGYSYRPHGWLLPLKKKFLKLTLSGSYPETESNLFFWQKTSKSFLSLVANLNRALDDETVTGVYVDMKSPRLGWAQIEELRNLFLTFREKGKPVVFHLDLLSGNGSYYLASSGNEVAMSRVDDLVLTGLLAQVTFVKGTLEKLGITADVEHAGKYKSASDLLTRDSISAYNREEINKLLDDIFLRFSDDIAQSRGFSPDSLKTAIDNAPLTSEEAAKYGLIDKVLYPDEIDGWLEVIFKTRCSMGFREYSLRQPYPEEWGEPPQIAVIPVEGTLMPGKSGEIPLWGRTIGADDLMGAIKYARKSNHIKAVVLRLDTPGGSGLEADLLHHELKLLAEKKPLIVSMSNEAASAGYYLASAGDYIYAEPTTLTGSIGVIYGKLDLSGLREKIGFNTYLFKRGENADFFSMSTGFSKQQREKMQNQLDLMYREFVQVVAEGRGLSFGYVDSIAQGRVWSGYAARDLALIDEFGGLWDSVQKARQMAGMAEKRVELVNFPKRPFSFIDLWHDLEIGAQAVKSIIYPRTLMAERGMQSTVTPYYYITPYLIEIY